MISRHDEEVIGEIVDNNTMVVVAAYTVYKQMCPKKPISKRDFFMEFDDNFQVFRKIFEEGINYEGI